MIITKMLIFILFFLVCVSSTILNHIAFENNNLCDSNAIPISVWDGVVDEETSYYYIYTITFPVLPSHGKLYKCSSGCTIKGDLITQSTLVRLDDIQNNAFMYEADLEYNGVDEFYTYVIPRDYTPRWIPKVYIKTIKNIVNILPMPSLPIINTTSLEVYDPDGVNVLQKYQIHLDDCDVITRSGFQGSCENQICTFVATSTTFASQIQKIDCKGSRLKRIRGYLVFQEKPEFVSFCPQFIQNAAIASTYINVVTNLTINETEIFNRPALPPTAISKFIITQEFDDIGYLKLNEDESLTYELYDRTTFSALSENTCAKKKYTIHNVSLETSDDIFFGRDVKWRICVTDFQRLPVVINSTIRNNWSNVPTKFMIDVIDFNDNTYGRDDSRYTQYSFRRNPLDRYQFGLLDDYSGLIFGQTVFNSSEIREGDCLTVLTPNIVYHRLDFCYVITGIEAPPEGVYVYALDTNYSNSLYPGFIEFEPSAKIIVCDTTEQSFIGNECTSSGLESNSKFGDSYIPIQFQTYAFPNNITFEIVFIVEQLPFYGSLYECGNIDCTIPGKNLIILGRRIKKLRDQPSMWYKGNPDYFNYVVYHFVGESNVLADHTSFVDRKGNPFGNCVNGTIQGCPDSFQFRYEHPYISGQGGTGKYDIYVQNRGSNFEFSYRMSIYANRYDSNIPVRIGYSYAQEYNGDPYTTRVTETRTHAINYNDPDGDTWEVELLVITINAYVGNINKAMTMYNLAYIPVVSECKQDDGVIEYCGGAFVIKGLPSDMNNFILNDLWFYNWPSYNNASFTQPVYFTMSKRFAIDTYSAENSIMVVLRSYLESYESDLNSCLQKKDVNSVPVSYVELFSPLRSMKLDASRVYIPGYFGSLTNTIGRFDPDEIQITPATDCTIKAEMLYRVVASIRSVYGSVQGQVFEALMYNTYGALSREPISVRRTFGSSIISDYTVVSNTLEYSFVWKGPRNQIHPIVKYIPPPAPSVDFWKKFGDFFLAGALTNPTPENIGLAILNIFLLFVPVPLTPILNVLTTPLRMIRGVGTFFGSRIGSTMMSNIFNSIRTGITPFKSGIYKAVGNFLVDKVFNLIIQTGTSLAKLIGRLIVFTVRTTITQVRNIVSLTLTVVKKVSKFLAMRVVYGARAFRASRANRNIPKIPPKPIRPTSWANPVAFTKTLKEVFPKPKINLGGIVSKSVRSTVKSIGSRIPSIKGRLFKGIGRGFNRVRLAGRRGLSKVRNFLKQQLRRLRTKIKQKLKKRKEKRERNKKKKKKNNRKKDKEKKKMVKRMKAVKKKIPKFPRIRPRKKGMRADYIYLPFLFILNGLIFFIQWILFLLFLPILFVWFLMEDFVTMLSPVNEEVEKINDPDSETTGLLSKS